MVRGGLLSVFAARSPTTEGSTVTAPAGAFAGPAGGSAQTRARPEGGAPMAEGAPEAEGAPDAEDVRDGFAGASDVLVQPVATSRSSTRGAVGAARRRRLITTSPP
ncbi:hypothetical protein SGA01_16110 [Streptomyces gardneri]|uniref:Uncharacterized protein n=1 Tax=Streptomyces gardneri TaxID=66892 RepID=A0A4Y3RE21_9ACTN|nr:hypothetical protein SGA01_16110 [Streptomyces gardneri]